jgi:hypothetical protein
MDAGRIPFAAANERITQRAVPRVSASAPNAAVQASASTMSGVTAAGSVTLTRSLRMVAAGFSASVNCLIESNMGSSPLIHVPTSRVF